jgi:hypothetical protein
VGCEESKRSQPSPHIHSTEDYSTPRPASPSHLLRPSHLHKRSHPSRHLRHRSCRCHRSCHHSRHPRRGKGPRRIVKLRAPAVVLWFLPKKRQIPQINGCCSPPSSPPPALPAPSPTTPCQPAIEFEDKPPLQLETPSAPPQVLSPRRAPSPLVSAPGMRSHAPSAVQPAETLPAETSSSSRSGYSYCDLVSFL